MKKNMVSVSKEKLYRELEKRGLNHSEVSTEIGFAQWFISNSASRGKINRTGAIMLEKLYNIKPEDYAPDPDNTPEIIEPVKEAQNIIDYEKLGEVIYDAVYRAVKTAWSE